MFLYITNQIQTVGSNNYSLLLIYFLSIVLAISVIIVKSPVVSILYLIGLFCTIAVYLVMSGMTFAGLMYLLVYVGAISILFIFIVMLLNVRISELLTEGRNSTILAILAILSIDLIFSQVLPASEGSYNVLYNTITGLYNNVTNNSFSTYIEYDKINVAAVTAKSWDNSLAEISHMSSIGNILYTSSIMFLLIVSLIILLAMIGAIVITVKSITRLTENDSAVNISTSQSKNSIL